MVLCSIVPVRYSSFMYHDRPLAMLLAHLTSDSSYVAQALINDNCYKIMDNSLIELGEAFGINDVLEAADKCLADEIILPDVFQDGDATVEVVKESIDWLRAAGRLHDYHLMAVCHGKDMEEFTRTFKALASIKEIDTIGIPKIVCSWAKTRAVFAELFATTRKEIHLLGVYDSFKELGTFRPEDLSSIRSVDTCMPALFASTGETDVFASRNGATIDLIKGDIDIFDYQKIIDELHNTFGV